MVCDRCIMVVKQILDKQHLKILTVNLGEAEVENLLNEEQLSALGTELLAVGFELLDDRKRKLIERVKTLIIEKIHHVDDVLRKKKFSVFLQEQLAIEYSYLSTLFSQIEGITIEQFIILQRIERTKELLEYNELTLSEIAYKLDYSSVQHLSTQFKKITGLTPSHFKTIKRQKRKSLDRL